MKIVTKVLQFLIKFKNILKWLEVLNHGIEEMREKAETLGLIDGNDIEDQVKDKLNARKDG